MSYSTIWSGQECYADLVDQPYSIIRLPTGSLGLSFLL